VRVTFRLPLTLALVAMLFACASPPPPVNDRTYAPTDAALGLVAVIPFYAHRSFDNTLSRGGVSEEAATRSVTRVVSEAIAEHGIDVVPGDAVRLAVADVTRITPAVDVRIFAEIADREFGATGVLLGEVLRFRDPSGASAAARRPGSVAFQLALYDAPDGHKLWAARFDETQSIEEPDLVSNPDDATPPEPWLSAEEIARNGAVAATAALESTR
jgi:hypothetical protein